MNNELPSLNELNKNLDEQVKHALNKYLEFNNNLWNACITLSGIFISVFSALIFIGNSNFINFAKIIVLFGIASVFFIISCYSLMRKGYKILGEMPKVCKELNYDNQKKYIEKETRNANNRRILIQSFEHCAWYLIIAQFVVLAIVFVIPKI